MPAENLKLRTFRFAVEVGKLVQLLPYSILNRHYFGQITRSSSSTAANYRAAQRAKSDADFLNKLKIVEEEADETVFFLELLLVFNAEYEKPIQDLIDEGTEILKMIVASINTMRSKIKNKK
ncbi:MAG: four helix bundle protein [Segetibacter sp.]|nr:four helix bundle protein [Segetibacter sp.]